MLRRTIKQNLFVEFDDHVMDCPPMENHKYIFMRVILEEFLRRKLNYIAKIETENLKKKI